MNMKFKLGPILMTNGVCEMARKDRSFRDFVSRSLGRHCECDWGDLCDEDKALNDMAFKNGDDRLFSRYDFNGDVSIYIITEWDRSATTLLFPSEY